LSIFVITVYFVGIGQVIGCQDCLWNDWHCVGRDIQLCLLSSAFCGFQWKLKCPKNLTGKDAKNTWKCVQV